MAELKKTVYIGGFGHWSCAAGELQGLVTVVGAAPAYDGEKVSALAAFPAFSDRFPLFESASEMLAELRPEIAVVSTRPDHIARTAVLAAEAGCDLICEKPLGLSLEEVRRVRDAVRTAGVRLLPMLSMRTDPVFMKARELYRAGAVGEAALINTRKSYRYGERPAWFGERAKYGGTFPWVGIHAADMMHFITGLEFVSVSARQANRTHPERPDCEDSCAAVFELTSGAFATASVDILRPAAAPTHGDDWIRIAGSRGVLEARSNEGVVHLINAEGSVVVPADSVDIPFYRELLKDGAFPLVGPDDGYLLTAAMLCARDSADRNGVPVPVEV